METKVNHGLLKIMYPTNAIKRFIRLIGVNGIELFLSCLLVVVLLFCAIPSNVYFFDFFIGGDFFWASFLVFAGIIGTRFMSYSKFSCKETVKYSIVFVLALITFAYFIVIKLEVLNYLLADNLYKIFTFIISCLAYVGAEMGVMINSYYVHNKI